MSLSGIPRVTIEVTPQFEVPRLIEIDNRNLKEIALSKFDEYDNVGNICCTDIIMLK